MKKILIVLLCMALFCGGALAEAAPGSPAETYTPAPGEQLGFELLKELYTAGENRVLSPQSLALALGMAAEGAQGDTLAEILDALGVQDVAGISANLPEGLKAANAVFTAPELELKAGYADRLNEAYGAEWFEIDADVVRKVNDWVKENTDELIEELLAEAPAADAGMILLNAVAMDAEWALPFDPAATAEEAFHASEGDLTVPMMHQTAYFDYAEKDGVQILRLPYMDSGLEMWIALPEAGGMDALLETLALEGMAYLKGDTQQREVILTLPKMDISDENTLNDALKQMGVQAAFADSADFSGISDMPMAIDEILQKARIQVDEQGTRAAAATAVILRMLSARPGEPVEMKVDRPFVFAIADHETGALCFAGAVENPAKN